MLRFNDGVEIDTSGKFRVRRLRDGYYVIGENWCIPVGDAEEGVKLIKKLQESTYTEE